MTLLDENAKMERQIGRWMDIGTKDLLEWGGLGISQQICHDQSLAWLKEDLVIDTEMKMLIKNWFWSNAEGIYKNPIQSPREEI